jgi:hypothetical protein
MGRDSNPVQVPELNGVANFELSLALEPTAELSSGFANVIATIRSGLGWRRSEANPEVTGGCSCS